MTEIRAFRAEKIRKPRNFVEPKFLQGVPLDLEIGCGVGWHPIQYAKQNPDRFLAAIEHTRNRFESFERRTVRHPELKNLMAIHADAIEWVTHALLPESVERIFLLYPNPYPKKSDLNKRWHAMPFMGRLLSVLKTGGELLLLTNERFYFEEAREYLGVQWKMQIQRASAFTRATAPNGAPRTHFEKKYLARGETCFELRALKVASHSTE